MSARRTVLASALTLITACSPGAIGSADGGLSCGLAREMPGVRWIPVAKGDRLRLEPYAAVLTCGSSELVLRATRPFGVRIVWEQDGASVVTRLGEEHFIVVHPVAADSDPGVEIEALAVSGGVFYSRDRDAIRRASVIEARRGAFGEDSDAEDRRYEELSRIGWRRLTTSDGLGAWDMIWTQGTGKLEIELQGRNGSVGVYNDVIDVHGHPTGKKRFRPNEYWILVPEFFSNAKVNKIIGEVWIATDRAKVQRFFEAYRTHHAWSQFPSPADKRAWYERLEEMRNRDPQGAHQVWQQMLKDSESSRREWERLLNKEELE